jgi:hypothetical protein
MAEAGFMGLAAAVIVDRQVAWTKGYGFADWQRTQPFTPGTIMNSPPSTPRRRPTDLGSARTPASSTRCGSARRRCGSRRSRACRHRVKK